ncbi:hypothetical protein GCM10010234_13330 [Streptomyces hawaiiensis]
MSRQHSVWRDEAATWQVAERSTVQIWHMLGQVDAVHGLYYLLMHGLFACFGPSTTTLRLPSVLAMAVAAGCVAVMGRRLTGGWAGLGGGLTFGLLPAVQFQMQEGRPYAFVTAGAAISTLLLVTALTATRHRSALWVAYGGTVLVCGLLNWLSLLLLLAHLVTLAWRQAGRGLWKRWVVASAVGAACVMPLILFTRSQSQQVSWIPPLSWHMMIGPAVLLAMGGLCVLTDRRREDGASVVAVGFPLLAVPQIALIGISLIRPMFLERYVLFSFLGLALLIGAALDTAVRTATPRFPRGYVCVLPAVLTVATVTLLPQSLAKRSPESRVDDVLAIASDVRRLKRPGDGVLFVPAARRDTKSVSPDAFTGLRDIALVKSPAVSGTLKGVETNPAGIRAAMLAQKEILLVTDATEVATPVTSPRDKAKLSVLDEHFKAVADEQVRGRRVTVYRRLEPTRF